MNDFKNMTDVAISLIDGCKPIIEIFKPESPAQEKWRKDWLTTANAVIKKYVEEQNIIKKTSCQDFKIKNVDDFKKLRKYGCDAMHTCDECVDTYCKYNPNVRTSDTNTTNIDIQKDWSWVCNECGSHELTSSVSEKDLVCFACSSCGCDEFHREYHYVSIYRDRS